jgi:uncharacterized membrane protein YidH (DUF202 family)
MSLLPSHELGSVAGLMFVVLGLAMIVLAATRFAFNAKSIDRAEQVPGKGSRTDLALALLLVQRYIDFLVVLTSLSIWE